MESAQFSSVPDFDLDSPFFSEQIDRQIEKYLPQFNRVMRQHHLFHLLSLLIGGGILLSFCLFLTQLVEYALLAVSLSVLFLFLFSYTIFRLYMRDRTYYRLQGIVNEYSHACIEMMQFIPGYSKHHLGLGSALARFSNQLHGHERHYFRPPDWLDFLRFSGQRLSRFVYSEYLFYFRQQLLLEHVEQHIEVVKLEPIELDVHVALANAYILLSSLYHEYQEIGEEMKERFVETVGKAMEEFKILNEFAPEDPWVHIQLAYSYRDLGLPKNEIEEYETILKLWPEEKEVLYRLGVLYFEQGDNAKGLHIYEQLKETNFRKAEQLIRHYGEC